MVMIRVRVGDSLHSELSHLYLSCMFLLRQYMHSIDEGHENDVQRLSHRVQ